MDHDRITAGSSNARRVSRSLLLAATLLIPQAGLMCPDGGGGGGGGGATSRPAVTDCGSVSVACFDELPRQPGSIIAYRPTSRWTSKDLTWSVELHPTLNAQAQMDTFQRAFDAWSVASGLTFTRVASNGNIRISFKRGEHGDPFPFDGSGRRLGHAWFPGSELPGEIHLCQDEDWAIPGKSGQFDLFTVALHEIGHAIGLEHTLAENAVMAYSYQGALTELAGDDVKSVRRLYGSADFMIQPVPVSQPGMFELAPPDLVQRGDPDSDRDGIPDAMEFFFFGTDPFRADTDGDGRTDYQEIFIDGTPPNVSGQDSDLDGLPDSLEANFFTSPNQFDSDFDDLSDGDEVLYLGTDPLNPDTDFDGFADGEDFFPNFPNFAILDLCAAGFGGDDCNFDGLLDECDIAFGFSFDDDFDGIPDECQGDSDGDGFSDDIDGCPFDPSKIDPGFCGCGFEDFDSDGDFFPDCFDGCPFDPFKIFFGCNGCGFADPDVNFNGIADCFE